LDSTPIALEYWYELVQTYSRCELSKTTDRLPALSGLAQALSTILNDTYAAGLWRSDIHVGLTWHCSHAVEILSPYVASETSRRYISKDDSPASGAPSWSWASTNSKVRFRSGTRDHNRDLTILSIHATPIGLDPFGKVAGGTLCVHGRLKRGLVKINLPRDQLEHKIVELHDMSGVDIRIAQLLFDYSTYSCYVEDGGTLEVAALLLSSDSDAYTKWIGLVLYKVGNYSNFTFERIGLALCHSPYKAGHDWFNDCEQQTIEIV
jgi:hypothetical protein